MKLFYHKAIYVILSGTQIGEVPKSTLNEITSSHKDNPIEIRPSSDNAEQHDQIFTEVELQSTVLDENDDFDLSKKTPSGYVNNRLVDQSVWRER